MKHSIPVKSAIDWLPTETWVIFAMSVYRMYSPLIFALPLRSCHEELVIAPGRVAPDISKADLKFASGMWIKLLLVPVSWQE